MMNRFALVALSAILAAPAMAQDKPGKDWNFGDGMTAERWSLVNNDYGMCDAGLMQSPIDLGSADARACRTGNRLRKRARRHGAGR